MSQVSYPYNTKCDDAVLSCSPNPLIPELCSAGLVSFHEELQRFLCINFFTGKLCCECENLQSISVLKSQIWKPILILSISNFKLVSG
jgi:hypothetical protein